MGNERIKTNDSPIDKWIIYYKIDMGTIKIYMRFRNVWNPYALIYKNNWVTVLSKAKSILYALFDILQ